MNTDIPTFGRSLILLLAPTVGISALPRLQEAGRAPSPLIQVDVPRPGELDLRRVDPAPLIPADLRDPTQVEQARRAWEALLAPFQGRDLRLRVPAEGRRRALVLAASQALRAARPDARLFLAPEPGQPAIWDPLLWGAVDGGVLLPEELGPDPAAWRAVLNRAQEYLPGCPWTLHLGEDPGPQAGALLGDGGRLVVPTGGPTAALVRELPTVHLHAECGLGDITLTTSGSLRPLRWTFQGGAWIATPPRRGEVTAEVQGQAPYDLGALLARIRAAQLRNRMLLRTLESRLRVSLHLQELSGPGQDQAYVYERFERMGEAPELVRREVLRDGVRVNLGPKAQLPVVEARVSLALPGSLTLTERFHYTDAGPAGGGRRRVLFVPVDRDPSLPKGELLVEEATGQILLEESRRDDLEGKVRTVNLKAEYGEVLPGAFVLLRAISYERWIHASGVTQVRREVTQDLLRPNAEGFEARREEARRSEAFMLVQTPEGMRYLTKGPEGARMAATRMPSAMRADVAGLIATPGTGIPCFPIGGRMGSDSNLLDRGIQSTWLLAVVVNALELSIPRLSGGFDLNLQGLGLLVPMSELPVRSGQVVKADQVARFFSTLNVSLNRDWGAGFRSGLETLLTWDHYRTSLVFRGKEQLKYATPGYEAPPGGFTRELRAELTWQHRGFQALGFYGEGRRPWGRYGHPADPQGVPDGGRFLRWGGSLGWDQRLEGGAQFHGEAGYLSGRGFDRFKSLDLGSAGDGSVPGFSGFAFASDRAAYAKVAVVLPPGPAFRLTLRLDHARIRALEDRRPYSFTGLAVKGALPGFWTFTYTQVELGVGIHSTLPGVRTVTGNVMLAKVL